MIARSLVALALLATPVHAELTKLGPYALTDTPKKSQFSKVKSVLGCAGSVRHVMRGDKLVGIELATSKCDARTLEAALRKEYTGEPIVSRDGNAKLWEGKTSAVVLDTRSASVRLGAPGPGAKRTCFADDGFAAFFQTFRAAVTAGKLDAAAASFAFPIKDLDAAVRIKDAKDFARQWPKLLDPADKQALAKDLEATCDLGTETYDLSLSNSNLSLTARKIDGRWQWVELDDQSGG